MVNSFLCETHTLYLPHRQIALQHRLRKIGSVFNFAVWQWTGKSAPNSDDHLSAIYALFDTIIRPEWKARSYNTGQKNTFSPLTLDLAQAKSMRLDNRYLYSASSLKPYYDYRVLCEQEWFIMLYHNFNDPPYGLNTTDEIRLESWISFCDLIGLTPNTQPQVFDWIRHETRTPHPPHTVTHPISNYFTDGLEWWGGLVFNYLYPPTANLSHYRSKRY
ncbi:MAG: hypothetical protein Q4A74_05495 [Cardiobacteriaceae bacterium]|nr:hypothetical protein [Cardiobacteriaceae bacterium]